VLVAALTGAAVFTWVETEEPDVPAPEATGDEPATAGDPQVESIAFVPVDERGIAEPVETALDQQDEVSSIRRTRARVSQATPRRSWS
jgi:hypothetical protein